MKGEHKPGYRAPKTGEKRKVRQPFKLDRLDQKVRDEILKRRAAGQSWQEISDGSPEFAGHVLAVSVLHRWYDVRVQQAHDEALAQSEVARQVVAAFAAKDFAQLPEAAMNALSSEVFAVMGSGAQPAQFRKALGDLVFLMSKLITAQAKEKQVDLDKERLDLDKKKFEQIKSKADKVTNEAAQKLGKGRALTVDDINRIRERTFGLGPVKPIAAAGSPA